MRISPNETWILRAVLGRERYGLEIIERVKALSAGEVSVPMGSLYTTLHRMEKKGLIQGRWGEEVAGAGARRRYYAATGLGEQALSDMKRVLAPAFRWRTVGGS
jgi:PadR family transcriptional regulator PadR